MIMWSWETIVRLRNMESVMEKMEIDYAKSSYRFNKLVFYDKDGNVIKTISHKRDEPWIEIFPDSRMERISKIIRTYAMKNYNKVARQTNTL